MKRQVVLLILDGWGIGNRDNSNPIHIANPENIDYIKTHFLTGALQASGIAVGLPWGEEGNSEVGHLTIGAGRVIYQHFPRITLSIRDGSFFKNSAFLNACAHANKNNSALNLVGLLTEGNVHASLEHVFALMDLAKNNGVARLNLHFFTDGKDSPPQSALNLLAKVEEKIKSIGLGKIASLSGRYYALNRDEHWDRTKKTYETLIGRGKILDNIEIAIKNHYQKKLSDEYLEPFLIGPEINPLKDNDAVIFFDFREDSIRQIAESFIVSDFSKFTRADLKNLYIATMTQYSDRFKAPVAYLPEKVENPLGKILADDGKTQLRIAETEKYAHVSYFFNGLKDAPFPNEYRALIPSKNVPRHDEYPEMMAAEITERVIQAVEEKSFDFILANFANPDIIAHTGNYDAAIKTIAFVDEQIGKILKICLEQDAILMITADHGNVERMINPFTGITETKHDLSTVPIYVAAREFQRIKSPNLTDITEKETVGILSDVAPTILELMGLPKHPEMTGQSLLKSLR